MAQIRECIYEQKYAYTMSFYVDSYLSQFCLQYMFCGSAASVEVCFSYRLKHKPVNLSLCCGLCDCWANVIEDMMTANLTNA